MDRMKVKSFLVDIVIPVIIAVVLALLIQKYLIYKVLIPTGSMKPTLNEGDHLFVTRVYHPEKLQRGDIVVFNSEELNEVLIKRLIGLPGEKVDIVDGVVYINGEKLDEPYVKNPDLKSSSFVVPEGKLLFLGDNRQDSYDAREWINPYIDFEDVMAKAQIRVYPFNEFGNIYK